MPSNEAMVLKEPGADLTFKASAAITGKRFVVVSGARTGGGMTGLSSDLANVYQMAQAGAGARAVGVAAWDVANGALGRCITGGKIVTVTSGAAVAAGAQVQADANGKAIALAAGVALGVAMTGVAGADTDLEVKLAV